MLTFNVVKEVGLGSKLQYCEGVCLSSDAKPISEKIQNGSKLMETDTSKFYIYDAANSVWREWQ